MLARQERMGPQGVGWPLLFRQISIAVRWLLPQERARLERGMDGFAAVKRPRICSGGREIWLVSWVKVCGMATEWKAVRAAVKKASGARPEQVPWVRHSCWRRPASG